MIGGVFWLDIVGWTMLTFRYLHTTYVRQILSGFFLGNILWVGDPKEYGYVVFDTRRVGLRRECAWVLLFWEYKALSCFWWMEVILGSTMGSIHSVLNHARILDPVYSLMWLYFEDWKGRPDFGQPVYVLFFFIPCLAISSWYIYFSTSYFLRGRLDLPVLVLSQPSVRSEAIR